MWFWDLISLLIALAMISAIVAIHEYGHMWVAKKFNVFIQTFSICFGKKIWSRKAKDGTEYRICAIPLGGYIKPLTDDDLNAMRDSYARENKDLKELDALSNRTLDKASPIARFLIAFAGPAINFISSIIVFVVAYSFISVKEFHVEFDISIGREHVITLHKGDIIANNIKKDGKNIHVKRNGEYLIVPIAESYNDFIVKHSNSIKTHVIKNPIKLLAKVSKMTYETIKGAFIAIAKLFTFTNESRKSVGGIVTIIQEISNAAKNGFESLMMMFVTISIGLGAVNLLPIPFLDGGRMMIDLITIITRRKSVNKKFENICSMVGLCIIAFLTFYTIGIDILRLIIK